MTALLATLAAYVPHRLATHIATAVSPPHAINETFPAAVLFADISGFIQLTDLLAKTEPEGLEELTRLLNDSFQRIIEPIVVEGGDVVGFSGDGITAVFPATQSFPIATRLAYQAGLAVQAAMAEIGQLQTSAGQVTLGIKVAIGAGEIGAVVAGGVRDRWEYIITGEPLRQIAIVESLAQRGQVLLSPEAQAIIQDGSRLWWVVSLGVVASNLSSKYLSDELNYLRLGCIIIIVYMIISYMVFQAWWHRPR